MKQQLAGINRTGKNTRLSFKSFNNSLKKLEKHNREIGIFVAHMPNDSSMASLVFAPIDEEGNPINGADTVSLELPCPPYCSKEIPPHVVVITPDEP